MSYDGSRWLLSTYNGDTAHSSVRVSYADSAGSVSWTNVSSRPTALSSFTNDLGNYGSWITQNQVSNNSGAYITDYPIGTCVIATTYTAYVVNAAAGIFIAESNPGPQAWQVGTAPNASYYHQLAGTWRNRGQTSSNGALFFFMFQRVA
jgi:hypothetical protein